MKPFPVIVILRCCLAAAWLGLLSPALAQQTAASPGVGVPDEPESLTSAPDRVDVRPVARDDEIQNRLRSVLVATGWFTDPAVRAESGVVFLNGIADSEELRKWAGDLARNTQGVVAVANRMTIRQASPWNFGPARQGLVDMWRGFVRSLPLLAFALVALALSFGAGVLAFRVARKLLRARIRANLLRNVVAYAAGILLFLTGVYVVLRIAGLTQLALTVIGGTGLVGLALGIAFRNISENFLASIFLSMQRPFEPGDLVEISGVTGYVQQLNLRTTVLMNLDGNLVQIPNTTVYREILRNFTANANRRTGFEVGIGYDDPIQAAQEVVRHVLDDHPAVLNDPEPTVLVESLGRATVNLRVDFWLDGHEHSWLKVRSSVIRLVKRAFQARGISMPDEAREVIFPQGVPVRVLTPQMEDSDPQRGGAPVVPERAAPESSDAVSTKAEAGLYSDAGVIEKQSREVSRGIGEDLLLKESSAARGQE
jgi:small conductance mechanosensitive channel